VLGQILGGFVVKTVTKIFVAVSTGHSILLAMLLLFGCVTTAHADSLRTVALSGEQALSTDPSVIYSGFGTPVLNEAGQVAFHGNLTGTAVNETNDDGIWSEGGGAGLALVARSGNQAPDTGTGVNFAGLGDPVLNNAGHTAFTGELVGTGVDRLNASGIWSEGAGAGLALVVRSGNQAPGTDSGVKFFIYTEDPPLLNDNGQTAFYGELFGPNVGVFNNNSIWSEGGDAGLALVARERDQVLGTSTDFSFRFLNSLLGLVFNNAGNTAFPAEFDGPGVDVTTGTGIWSEGRGLGPTLIARTGDQAPGTDIGVNFFNVYNPAINDAGQIAFSGGLTVAGGISGSGYGIWSEGGGEGLALVVRSGTPAPGTDPGATFRVFSRPVLNSAGQTAFWGQLTGTGVSRNFNDTGLWREKPAGDVIELVARAGNQVPGMEAGFYFRNLSQFDPPALNGAGQIAFQAYYANGKGDFGSGIWAEDLDGTLQLIARTGDLLDVSDDPHLEDLRTISDIMFNFDLFEDTGTGNEDGRRSSFNDRGQLAFTALFTDGTSGVFVSNLVAVPEPTTSCLVLACSLITVSYRQRNNSYSCRSY